MITERLGLDGQSSVVEIASNDGYLLKNFVAKGIRVLGVEPAANVAAAGVERGVPSVVKFFGRSTARELVDSGVRPTLLIGNNVLAHVPTSMTSWQECRSCSPTMASSRWNFRI